MSDLRLGVLGYGVRGSLAREAHRPDAGARVVAVCDLSEHALAAARDAFGGDVDTTTDPQALAAMKLDAALVLTPDDVHVDHAETLLAAGIPVYLEKPMATSVEDCDRVLAAARRHQTKLYVGHNMRHMPVVVQMRELVNAGAIGEVKAVWCRHFVGHGGDFYFKDWHADRSRSVGLLLQKGAHDLDVIHWLAGGFSRRVTAMGGLTVYGGIDDRRDNSDKTMWDWFSLDNWPPLRQTGLNPVVDVEDLSMVTMALDNGVFATYEQCHYTPDYWRNYTVIGTEGRLENFGDGAPGSVIRVWDRRVGYNPDGDHVVPVRQEEGGHAGADGAILEEFFRFVRYGDSTATSPIAARQAVATACAATESLRSGGGRVDVVPPRTDDLSYFDPSSVGD